jgi:hypothetical protein
MWEDNPGFLALMDAQFSRAEAAGAQAAATFLAEKLDQPGTGKQWPGLPNISSAPGQYPAKQSGALLASIKARQVNGVWFWGSFNTPPEGFYLEYPKPGDSGARPWMSKALSDPELYERVWRAMSEVLHAP